MKNCVSCNKELSDQTHAMYHGYCLDCGSSKTSKISYYPGTRIRKHAEVLPADSHVGPPTHQIIVDEDERIGPVEQIQRAVDKKLCNSGGQKNIAPASTSKISRPIVLPADKPKDTKLGRIVYDMVVPNSSDDCSQFSVDYRQFSVDKTRAEAYDCRQFSVDKTRAEAYQALFENIIYKNFGKDIPITQQLSRNVSRILNEREPMGNVKISHVRYKYVDFMLHLYKHEARISVFGNVPFVLNDDLDKIIDEFNKASFINNEFRSFNSKIEEYMKDRNYVFEISDMFAHFRL